MSIIFYGFSDFAILPYCSPREALSQDNMAPLQDNTLLRWAFLKCMFPGLTGIAVGATILAPKVPRFELAILYLPVRISIGAPIGHLIPK